MGLLGLFAATSATRVQLMPDVIDFTTVPDLAGVGGLLFAGYGAARGFGPDRLGRVTLFGNLLGALFAVAVLLLGGIEEVLS